MLQIGVPSSTPVINTLGKPPLLHAYAKPGCVRHLWLKPVGNEPYRAQADKPPTVTKVIAIFQESVLDYLI